MKNTSSTRSSIHAPILPMSIEPLEERIAPATLIVTTLKDTTDALNDTGSLRDAILLANADSGNADTIIFQTSNGHPLHGTIKLKSDLPVITNSLTITGPIHGKSNGLIIDGHNHQIFNITKGDVTMTDLTITHGLAPSGGGIYVYEKSGTLTLTDVTITKNRAASTGSSSPTVGGGLAVNQAQLVMTDSKITDNTVIGSTGTDSYAGGGAYGGGIWVRSYGAVTITNTIISGNVARGGNALASTNGVGISGGEAQGGGIYLFGEQTPPTIHHSVISGNKAIGGNGSNGAPGTNGTPVSQGQNGTVGGDGNKGGYGGYAQGGGFYGNGFIYDSTISGNIAIAGSGGMGGAGGKGGAGGASYISNNGFHPAGTGGAGGSGGQGGPNGKASGAGIQSDGSLSLYNSTISGNILISGHIGKGGAGGAPGSGIQKGTPGLKGSSGSLTPTLGAGIYDNNSLALSEVTIANNSGATVGGGVYINGNVGYPDDPIIVSIHNCTIARNQASASAGGLKVVSSTVDLVSTILALNMAKTDPDVAGSVSANNNLFGILTPDAVLTADNNNITTAAALHLGKLGMHGGPTATMVPSLTSSVIDAGSNPDYLFFDQRGNEFARFLGTGIDIGAIEVH